LIALAEETFEEGYYGANNVIPITKGKKKVDDGRKD